MQCTYEPSEPRLLVVQKYSEERVVTYDGCSFSNEKKLCHRRKRMFAPILGMREIPNLKGSAKTKSCRGSPFFAVAVDEERSGSSFT